MKIILAMHLPYLPALGGANKCNRALAEALVKKGHMVRAIVLAATPGAESNHANFRDGLRPLPIGANSEDRVEIFSWNGVEVHAHGDPSRMRRYLTDQIVELEADWVLLSCEEWSQGLLDAALKAAPGRVVYLAHTLLFLPFGPQAYFPSSLRTQWLANVAAIVAVGQFVHDYIEQWSGLPSTIFQWPVYGAGPFPNHGRFDDGFVTLVNPSAGKGIDIFIALAARLPQVQFAAVPTWGTTDENRLALESLPNVRLLEPCEDFDRILAQTRVLVMPSLWQEAFGLTVVEAMLRGIPVLASNAGGLPEAKLGTDFVLPVRGIEGFTEELDDRLIPIPVVPEQSVDDVDQWHAALRLLVSDRALYEKHSASARAAALEFVSTLSFDPFENLLNRLTAQRNDKRLPSLLKQKNKEFFPRGDASDLTARLKLLTPEQRALLLQRLQRE
jgi:glycosyltransferase involved in cell wall biosynthesis